MRHIALALLGALALAGVTTTAAHADSYWGNTYETRETYDAAPPYTRDQLKEIETFVHESGYAQAFKDFGGGQ
ncbi:hypothetical protein [Streptomyces sp. NPDC087525]|uniref:hypothetical protein n=1 Tax=Streptomyces sp. NPDC087525 TaxID=3365793 RepID=UPI003824785B